MYRQTPHDKLHCLPVCICSGRKRHAAYPIRRQQMKSIQNRHSLQQSPQDMAVCYDTVRAGPVLPRRCTLAEGCLPHTWCQMGSLSTCSRQVCCATSPMPQAGARPSAAQAARLAQLHWQPPLRVQETLPYLKGSSGGESNTTHLCRAFCLKKKLLNWGRSAGLNTS